MVNLEHLRVSCARVNSRETRSKAAHVVLTQENKTCLRRNDLLSSRPFFFFLMNFVLSV